MPSESAPVKWTYWEHTRVKHEILKGYLAGWLSILGKYHPKVCYFDCFAGRGEYQDGSPGSPVIAMQIANDLIERNRVGQVVCAFIEKDADNFENLRTVIDRHKGSYPHVKVLYEKSEFAVVISRVVNKVGSKLVPSFFFVDPFGFAGVPFALIKDILAIPRTEVFITFMYDSINRFLSSAKVETLFDSLFGTEEWRTIVSTLSGRHREHALRDLYIEQLRHQAGAHCTRAFRVSTDEKFRTLYYLIHATNHKKGAVLMKEVMHRKSAPGMFAYLGPQDYVYRYHPRLFDENDIPGLENYLLGHFAGRQLTYDEIQEESWETPFIDKHFREALKELRKKDKINATPVTSKTERGLRGQDKITFA